MIKRLAPAALISSGVTFGLFFIMQLLIATGDTGLQDEEAFRILDMVQQIDDSEALREERKPEKPPEPEVEPDLDIPKVQNLDPSSINVNTSTSSVKLDLDLGSGFGAFTDGDYLPIVKVQPIYPRRAQERGISGYVLLEFTVTELGTVEDVVVIEAEPKGYFERAARRAAMKFKYKPKVINNEAIRVPGVRNLITFEIQDD
jgi:protein TonB